MDRDRLQAFLDAVEPERRGTVLECHPMPGGYSRNAARATVQWTDGSTESLFLRGDPPEGSSIFRSDRDLEWALLNALAVSPTFRIPRPRYYDATGEYLGSRCIIDEAIPAQSMFTAMQTETDLQAANARFVDVIVSIHTMPLDVLGPDIPRPASWRAHMDSLIGQLDEIQAGLQESNPVLHYVARVMRENLPREVPLALVHGDVQPGNVLVPEGQAPVIIDWEFSHIGDPRQDLGMLAAITYAYKNSPAEFSATYRERTGMADEDLNSLLVDYFLVLGTARLLQHMILGAEALAQGEHQGIKGPYLIKAITHFHNLYLNYTEQVSGSRKATA